MRAATRYRVKTFLRDANGEFAAADDLELPSEEAAIYAASACVLGKAGAVVIAVTGDAQPTVKILRSYGLVPTDDVQAEAPV